MKNITLLSFAIIFIATLAGILSFNLPAPSNAPSMIFHIQLAVAIIMAIFYIGAAVLFFIDLKRFTTQLKIAYALICTGFLLLAIAQIQLPIFQALNLWSNSWVTGGGIQVPYIIAAITILIGMVKFSKLLDIKSILNSWLAISIIVVVGTSLLYFCREIIYPYRPGLNIFTGFTFVLVLITLVFFAVTTDLILKIKQQASAAYTNSLAWFFLAMVAVTLTQLQVVICSIIGFDSLWVTRGYFHMVYLISGLLFLKAGHAFNKIKIY